MKLTDAQVLHVAKLARLALTPDDVAKSREALSAILDAVDTLAEVDTADVEPTTTVGRATVHQRDDVVQGELGASRALAAAPAVDGGSFSIPKVIE